MKEALANVASRERQQIIDYLTDMHHVLAEEHEMADIEGDHDRAQIMTINLGLLEDILTRLDEKKDGKKLEFRYRDIGL